MKAADVDELKKADVATPTHNWTVHRIHAVQERRKRCNFAFWDEAASYTKADFREFSNGVKSNVPGSIPPLAPNRPTRLDPVTWICTVSTKWTFIKQMNWSFSPMDRPESTCPAKRIMPICNRTLSGFLWMLSRRPSRIWQSTSTDIFKAPNPGIDVFQLNEDGLTDTVYADTSAIDCGHTLAQIFFGSNSHITAVYGIKSTKSFLKTLQDFVRQWGAPNRIIADHAIRM